MSILLKIIGNKKEELGHRKSRTPLVELKERARDIEAPRDFETAIRRGRGEPVRLIAEIKKASPSRGIIRQDFDLGDIVSVYDSRDVQAISVLTDELFFGGHIDYLTMVRKKTKKPLLRKDFIVDEYQVFESRAFGADTLLLIAAALEGSQLSDLLGLSREIGMVPLVEVHNINELELALSVGAAIVGINNRDLKTLAIDMETTFSLRGSIPNDRIIVSESGIRSREDVKAMEDAGIDAILVGTTIMQADDIGSKIDELMGHIV